MDTLRSHHLNKKSHSAAPTGASGAVQQAGEPSSASSAMQVSSHMVGQAPLYPGLLQQSADGAAGGDVQLKGGKGIRFEAGTGSAWHVHKDHVKYGTNNGTRVNFAGRNAAKILEQLGEVLDAYPGLANGSGLDACREYINTYY